MEPFDRRAPSLASVPEIERREIGAIPLFHLPADGPTTLSIGFRVGRADEPIAQGGITHLAEHLIMSEVSDMTGRANGLTAAYRMTLTRRGTPAECAIFLGEVCAAIRQPPFSRIGHEVTVLRTEGADRGVGIVPGLLLNRYGFEGPGRLALPEFFLRNPDPDALRAWIARHLVAQNAAIWVSGEVPDDLAVDLPDGARKARPSWAPIAGLQTPTQTVGAPQGISFSFVARRSMAMTMALNVLEARIRRALRVTQGLAYEIGGDRILTGAQRQEIAMWITCLPESLRQVTWIALAEIDRLADRGPTPEELDQRLELMVRDALDPVATLGRLDARMEDELVGDEWTTMAELAREQAALTSENVAAALVAARSTMLVLAPEPGLVNDIKFHPYPGPPVGDMGAGRTFALNSAPPRIPGRALSSHVLRIGERGAWIDGPRGRAAAIPWSDAVAVVRNRQSREILARDGSTISLNPGWRDSAQGLRLIDQLAPLGTVIPVAPWPDANNGGARPNAWKARRRSLFVLVVGLWVTLLWALSSPTSRLEMVAVGFALSAVITMLSTSWTEG